MIKSNCTLTFEKNPPDSITVSVSGEIDHHAAVSLRRDTDAVLWDYAPKKLTIDMSGIEFMDSSGLGFIMGRYDVMRKLGGVLFIRDPSPCVEKMLKLTGFDRRVTVIKNSKERQSV
ncbi:MAG: STAS domain-containing protein [Clostridia bacterium]|nr:STAS domain-containing protein [Clostridia bacterium]